MLKQPKIWCSASGASFKEGVLSFRPFIYKLIPFCLGQINDRPSESDYLKDSGTLCVQQGLGYSKAQQCHVISHLPFRCFCLEVCFSLFQWVLETEVEMGAVESQLGAVLGDVPMDNIKEHVCVAFQMANQIERKYSHSILLWHRCPAVLGA